MLTKEENDLITQVGPGTPGGTLLRSYWQPAALSEELPQGGPPIPLRLFGEDLVMFRDEDGRIGLLGMHCSHRGTDLSYGRIEDGGLRCVYHGWLYDIDGRCLQTPAEPPGSHLKEFVRHQAYPCQEKGGVIFTYMGSEEPPLLPNYEVLSAPAENRFTTKHFIACNYLQSQEGSSDGTHVSFLHRFLRTETGAKQLSAHPRAQGTDGELSFRDTLPISPDGYTAPRGLEENDFSLWTHDETGAGSPSYTFPNLTLTRGGLQAFGDGYQIYWPVPIDDTHNWFFVISFKRSGPIPEEHRHARSWALMTPNYHFRANAGNRYLQDREEQQTSTFTGMGATFIVQDLMANESQGQIQDRTKEMTGVPDMPIVAWRRMLLRAVRTVQEGGEAPGRITDPRVNDVDPIFLKRNAPPSDGDLEALRADTDQRWFRHLAMAGR